MLMGLFLSVVPKSTSVGVRKLVEMVVELGMTNMPDTLKSTSAEKQEALGSTNRERHGGW